MKRKDVEEKYTWSFSDYFSNDDEWEKTLNTLEKDYEELSLFKGKLKNKKDILDCIKFLEKLDVKLDRLYVYANCNSDLDVTNTTYQGLVNKIEDKVVKFSEASSFVESELSKNSEKFLKSLIEDKDFSNYKRLIEGILREKSHILDEKSEKLLASISFAGDFGQNHSNFTNGDLKFREVKNKKGKSLQMSNSLANVYLRSDDEILRQNAYRELQGAYGRYNNFLTSNYLGSVKKDVYFAKTKNFKSSLESALFYEEIDKKVYQNLIENVEKNLKLNQKYFEIKRKILKLKTFKLSDIYFNPLKNTKKYSYEEGINIIKDALSILGEDYTNCILEMVNTRKIDVFPTENKRSGAYETIAPTLTPRVLTNYTGTFNDISTLAHELGHAMHSVYSNKENNPFNANYTIFLAEIASTVNETILNDYMLENSKKEEEKLFYLNEFLSNFYATVFRQTMFASFEEKVHEKVENNEGLSCKTLNDLYFGLNKLYFGRRVKLFDEVKYEWSRIPHFYTPFYVYKYATGLISAINIVQNLKSGEITVDDYKKFLSSGGRDKPTNLLKIVKVDYDTTKPFEVAFNYLDTKLKETQKYSKNF